MSWQGDQVPEAIGEYLNQKGVKPSLPDRTHAAGNPVIACLKQNFKGTVAGEEYTKWPGPTRLLRRVAKARAALLDAVFAFSSGAAGIQFSRNMTQAGLRPYASHAFVIDALSLPRLGELALGISAPSTG